MNRRRLPLPLKLGVVGQAVPSSAHASFLPPEMMDSAAMGLAWFNIVAVPIGAIVLFRMVRVLPEKIAHKRHHPQRDAIQVALGGGFGPPALEAVATK